MISRDTTRSDTQPHDGHEATVDSAFIQQRLRDMAEGLVEAIDREVARRRHEGLPIHVYKDGRVVDLQQEESGNRPA